MLGGFAFVLFAIVFFRLWFLQVLSGDDYVSQARENRVRKIKIEAPRGDIVDRDGNVLVTTRIAAVVQIIPSQLPEPELKVAEDYRTALSGAERGAARRGREAARVRPAPQAEGPQADEARAQGAPRARPGRVEGAARRDPADARGHPAASGCTGGWPACC